MNKRILITILVISVVVLGIKHWSSDKAVDDSNFPWKTLTDSRQNISFKYPERLLTEYMHVIDWPPKVQIMSGIFQCVEGGSESVRGKTERRMVDNRSYCVTKTSEGAAGSIYTAYKYITAQDDRNVVITFSLGVTQCGNYPTEQKIACENERQSFDLDSLIDRIVQSIEFN